MDEHHRGRQMITATTEPEHRDKPGRTAFISAPHSTNTGGIRRILQRQGIEAVTTDQIAPPGRRLSEVLQEAIGNADVVLAIIDSGVNSYVFFELGFAQALNKRTLILVDADVDLPFDADVGATLLRTKLDNTQAIEAGITELLNVPHHGTAAPVVKQANANRNLTDQLSAEAREIVGPSPETIPEVNQAASGDGPSDGDWSEELNERRIELIDKDIQLNITTGERAELADLQRRAVAYRDRVAPLPVEGARRLHQELLEMKRQWQGS
jgi:nucleoside 2-deoxyribosyltransferase